MLTSRTSHHTETIYAITDRSWGEIRADQLTEAIRGHGGIENRLHWIRDVVFAEDHSQIRTGAGPAVMATLRNLAVSLHRLAGAANIAAACRRLPPRQPTPQPASSRYSYNGQINFAEALGPFPIMNTSTVITDREGPRPSTHAP